MEIILAGDVGGTNVRLGLFHCDRGALAAVGKATYPSHAYAGLEAAVDQFLSVHKAPLRAAAFGIAGPVLRGTVRTPNLPWVVEAASLARSTGTSSVVLLNDLEANAYGLGVLQRDRLATLIAGESDPVGNAALISAGTGLGEAGLFFDGRRLRPFASEGGHADFAPTDALQMDLLTHLRARYGRVSYERVLSGPGLAAIFEFLTASGQGDASPELVAAAPQPGGPAAVSAAALAGTSTRAAAAVELFAAIYGAAAGNLALTLKATHGVFLGGGIAPRMLAKLDGDRFREGFLNKGRMRPLLEKIPVRVILDDECALLGAALRAGLAAGWPVETTVG